MCVGGMMSWETNVHVWLRPLRACGVQRVLRWRIKVNNYGGIKTEIFAKMRKFCYFQY